MKLKMKTIAACMLAASCLVFTLPSAATQMSSQVQNDKQEPLIKESKEFATLEKQLASLEKELKSIKLKSHAPSVGYPPYEDNYDYNRERERVENCKRNCEYTIRCGNQQK